MRVERTDGNQQQCTGFAGGSAYITNEGTMSVGNNMLPSLGRRTGWIWHERYMWHHLGPAAAYMPARGSIEPDRHADYPETKRRLSNLINASGLIDSLVSISPRLASVAELERVHAAKYIARVEELDRIGYGDAGESAFVGPGSFEIARLAVGGCLRAVDAVLGGEVENAYALVRPAGHHAVSARGMGSCIFNNVSLAAKHALDRPSVDRVAIVDWDVHHGNGTQDIFWEDPAVLAISLHQADTYPPGSGAISEVGGGGGQGFTINVPLPPGSGHGAYMYAVERVVVEALHSFNPDLILVASGLDASALDPLGRMLLHSRSYGEMTQLILDVADEVCGGRVVVCHEGGYSAAYVPFCGVAVVERLADVDSGVEDPFLPALERRTDQALQPHQAALVDAVVSARS